MMRKITAILLALVIAFSLVSCSKAKNVGGEGVISPVPKDGKLEMTILISSIDYNDLPTDGWLADYIAKFKRDFGVDIKFEQIKKNSYTWESRDEYLKKLFVKLFTKDGPELIYNRYISLSLEPLVEQQAVVDLRGKVANIDKIYDSLVSDSVYNVPLGVDYIGIIISRAALAELEVEEPGMNWMPEDYYAVRNKWISNNEILFNRHEYSRAFEQFIDLENLYKVEEKKVVLNTPEVSQKVNDLRSYIFGGAYQLIEGYKYENYYNMLFEAESEEWKNELEARVKSDINGDLNGGQIDNLLRAKDLQEWIKEYAIVKDPIDISKGVTLGSYGFLVNKNGKHLDLAYEFINGLLSNEVQMSMFEYESDSYPFYPVNKEIEADILKLEAEEKLDPKVMQIKAFALQELKDGKTILSSTIKTDLYELKGMIYKDMTKLILADNPYSDEQLQVELKRMEDKYNIYLNE
jgi:ABC-type glycerol-3-phosphate transport system substrate-binding protein